MEELSTSSGILNTSHWVTGSKMLKHKAVTNQLPNDAVSHPQSKDSSSTTMHKLKNWHIVNDHIVQTASYVVVMKFIDS